MTDQRLIAQIRLRDGRPDFGTSSFDVFEELMEASGDDFFGPHVVQLVIELANRTLGYIRWAQIFVTADSTHAPFDSSDRMPDRSRKLWVQDKKLGDAGGGDPLSERLAECFEGTH